MKRCKILVNLDCIFDVLFGCVIDINESWAIPLVKSGYLARKHNTLSLLHKEINDNLIKERWKNRDVSLLKLTKRTNLINLLTQYISQSLTNNSDHPDSMDFHIVINTFPYEFSNSELKELFTCLKFILGTTQVTRVHIPISDMSPIFLSSRYNRFIIYDFNEWYGLHKDSLAKNKIPLITCVVPLCCIKGKEDGDEEFITKWGTAALASALNLEFVRLADMSFCLIDNHIEDEK